jgi:hypothetical protein
MTTDLSENIYVVFSKSVTNLYYMDVLRQMPTFGR